MSSLLRPWKRRVPHALAAVLLLAGSALAQTTVAVSGHALIPDGTAASSVKMRFELIGCSNGQARIDGVAIFSDYKKDFTVDAVTGAFSGVIYPNVAAVSTNGIDCKGTYGSTQYLVTVLLNNRPNGKSVSYVVGPGAFNLDTAIAAVTDPAVVIPTAVVTTPQGGAEQDISGPLSATQFKCNGGSCTPATLSVSSTGSGSFVLDFAPILRGTEIDQGTIGGIAILSKRIDDFNPTGYFTLLRNNANSQDIYGVDVKGSILLRETSGQQNPPANMLKFYSDASTHLLKCLRSDGTDCNPAGGGGGGSVTNFSAGTLSPLFTTSVATPTTTPVLSFTLSNFAAHTFYGNNTGSSGAPGAVAIGAADLPSLSGDVTGAVNATVVGKVNGVTYSASPSTDTAPIVTAANTATYTSILNCGDSSHALAYSTSTHTFSCQAITGSAAAGGSNTQVQYNNGGSLGGITNMTSNGTDVTKLTAGAGPFDLSAATITKLRVAGGLTTSANGDCGYDSTAKAWHCWQNGADRLMIAATNLGSAGQPCLSNGDGSCTNADPITSGNQAAAAAQTITATGAKTGVAVTNIGQVLVTVSGTYAGVAFNFEATPDGTFTPAFPVQATQADAAAVATATGALPSNTTRAWFVDVAGFTQFRVNATAYTSGTANITITPVYFQFAPLTTAQIVGTPAVTANAGTNLNTSSLALDTTVAGLEVAQGSTTSGQKGALIQAAVTTAAPSYTTAQTSPLSLTPAGRLRIDGSGTTQPISGSVDQGNPNIGSPWLVRLTDGAVNTPIMDAPSRAAFQKITDGTNTAAVKAASTGAAAADPSLVVQISPNQAAFPVTANAGTNLNTSALALDATLTGGTAKGIVRGGQKGTTNTNADITHTPSGANHELIDIGIYDGSGNQITSFGGGTQYAEGTTQATATGTVALGKDPSNVVSPLQLDASKRLIVSCTGCSASSAGQLGTPLYVQPPGNPAYSAVKPGLAASNAALIAGLYSATPPVLIPGQQAAFQFDRYSRLIMAPPSALPPVKLTLDGNTTVGSPTSPLYTATVPATMPASYHATTGTAGIASAASATDIFTISGSSTAGVAILVNRIQVSCTQTTAGILALQVLKRSTADSGGTSTAVTETPDDSKFGASGASILKYTANPTLGTAVGDGVDSAQIGCLAAATASSNDVYLNILSKPTVLRGSAEQLTINLGGVTVTGSKFTITVDYMAVAGI